MNNNKQQQLKLWLVILAMHQYRMQEHEMGQLVIGIFVFVLAYQHSTLLS